MNKREKEFKFFQKEEAVKRMEELKLLPAIIKEFEKDDVIYYSENFDNQYFKSRLSWVSNNEELMKKVECFEKQTNNLVYHVQLTHTEIGDMYSFMYVSSAKDEWEMDMEDLQDNRCFVFVWNGDIEEYGSIGIQSIMGGVTRIW